MDNEKVLIEKAQKGEIDAFTGLISTYKDRVFDIAYRLAGNKSDADDLFQEVFIRVFNSIKYYKGNSEFSTWLYSIAHNLFVNFTKRPYKKFLSIDRFLDEETEESLQKKAFEAPKHEEPHEIIHDTLFEDRINEALQKLDKKFQLPVIFIHIEGFTYEETAEVMQEPIGTVKSRLNRGLKLLKEILEKDGTFSGLKLSDR